MLQIYRYEWATSHIWCSRGIHIYICSLTDTHTHFYKSWYINRVDLILSLIHTHTLSPSPFLTHTRVMVHQLRRPHSLSLSLSLTYTLLRVMVHEMRRPRSLIHTHTHSLCLSFSHTHEPWCTNCADFILSLSLSLSHTHTYSYESWYINCVDLVLSFIHTHTHTFSLSHTHES